MSRTNVASALPMGSPSAVAIFASSTRLTPLAITSTGFPLRLLNTSDFAICATVQPIAAAASAEVRAVTGICLTCASEPAARNSSCTLADAGLNASLMGSVRQLSRAPRRRGYRLDHKRLEAIRRHQHVERRTRGAAGAGDGLAELGSGLVREPRELARARHRRAREPHREIRRQTGGGAGLRQALDQQEHVGGTAAGDR